MAWIAAKTLSHSDAQGKKYETESEPYAQCVCKCADVKRSFALNMNEEVANLSNGMNWFSFLFVFFKYKLCFSEM